MPEPSETLRAFVDCIELQDIGYYELFGARGLPGPDGGRPVIGPGRLDSGSDADESSNELGVFWSDDRSRVLVRMRSTLRTDAGEISVGVQAEYAVAEEARDAPLEIEQEFVNRVAIMAIVPYTRTAIADLSARLFGVAHTLGVIRPGDIAFAARVRRVEIANPGASPSTDD